MLKVYVITQFLRGTPSKSPKKGKYIHKNAMKRLNFTKWNCSGIGVELSGIGVEMSGNEWNYSGKGKKKVE